MRLSTTEDSRPFGNEFEGSAKASIHSVVVRNLIHVAERCGAVKSSTASAGGSD